MSSKLDVLINYRLSSPPLYNRIRDSWYALGENTIKTKTKIYNEGMLYKIDSSSYPNSTFKGGIVFCEKEYIGALNWNNATLVDEDYGEIIFSSDIISSHFYLVLSLEELKSITESIDENFIPFRDTYEGNETVKISDSDYKNIMTCMGVPFIREEELEFTKQEINELAIKPALETMFKWCPKTREEDITVTTSVQNVPMPDDAYGVIGLSLQQYGAGNGSVTNPLLWSTMVSPFLDINSNVSNVSLYGSLLRNSSNSNNLLLGNAAQQGFINYRRRVHYEGPYEDRSGDICGTLGGKYITVYSNIEGTFNIWWGIQTLNFNDIEFAQRDNAFKLCKAKVKQLFGNLRRQSKSDIPGQVDYNYLIEEGIKEEQEVIDSLKKIVKSSGVLRGSL